MLSVLSLATCAAISEASIVFDKRSSFEDCESSDDDDPELGVTLRESLTAEGKTDESKNARERLTRLLRVLRFLQRTDMESLTKMSSHSWSFHEMSWVRQSSSLSVLMNGEIETN